MLANLTRFASRERAVVLALIGCGALARLVWTSNALQLKPVTTESHNVAMSLVRTGRFADPFANGGDWTAHVGMLTPLPSAAGYWLFGIDTPAAEFVLSLWAIGITSLSIWLCWRLFCALGAPVAARLAAVAFVSLAPLQFGLEVREGRSWEVGLAVMLLLWILLRLVAADRKDDATALDLAATGALSGFLFIVNPPAGLAAVAAIGLFQLLRLRLTRWWIAPAAFVLIAGLLGGYWAERNMVRLGAPIALRDNFGLELDLSNHSGAVNSADPKAVYLARLEDIHPLTVGPGNEKLRAAGGEVPYYNALGKEAEAWIASHPSDFLRLSAKRFVQFFLPPKWYWGTFGGGGKIVSLRQAFIWIATILGACTLVLMAFRRRDYLYLLAATLVCSLPYTVIQPILRYRYLVSSMLIFLAFDGATRLARYFAERRNADRQDAERPA